MSWSVMANEKGGESFGTTTGIVSDEADSWARKAEKDRPPTHIYKTKWALPFNLLSDFFVLR